MTVYQYTVDLDDYRDNLHPAEWEEANDDADLEKGAVADEEKHTSVTVLARWDQFQPTYRGRPQQDADPLDPEQVYE